MTNGLENLMVNVLPFIHQPDRLAREASDVSAADWRYQTNDSTRGFLCQLSLSHIYFHLIYCENGVLTSVTRKKGNNTKQMEKKNKTRFLETEADLQGDRLSAFFISIPIL